MKGRSALAAKNPLIGQTIACFGKKRFATWNEAMAVASRKPGKVRKEREHREPYHCRHCGGVHLGHTDRLDTRRRRRPRIEDDGR